MKTLFKAAALAAMTVGSAGVLPQVATAQSNQAVLTVDVEQLLTTSTAAQSGRTQMTARYDARINTTRANLAAAETAVNAARTAAQGARQPNGTVPAPQQQAFDQAAQRYNTVVQQAGQLENEVNAINRYVQGQILQAAEPVIEQVRRERRALIAIPKGSTLAADANTDVTSLVLQRLNQSFTTVTIDPPQQPAQPAQPAQRPPQPPGR
jgi:Skp family chaperone for outer membrane proteins